jgi:putative transposase
MGGETVMAKHAFITAHKTAYSIRSMCRVLSISTSWFHARSQNEEVRQAKAKRDLGLVGEIRRVIKENKSCYGSLRVFHKLVQEGVECTAYMVRKLMNVHDIRQPKRKNWVPRTTDSNHNHRIAPNLLDRQFEVFEPNKVWLADITYSAPRPGSSGEACYWNSDN